MRSFRLQRSKPREEEVVPPCIRSRSNSIEEAVVGVPFTRSRSNSRTRERTTLPYVKQKIRQKLQGVSFSDDSDDDTDWRKEGLEVVGRREQPQRGTRRLVDLISSESSDEEG